MRRNNSVFESLIMTITFLKTGLKVLSLLFIGSMNSIERKNTVKLLWFNLFVETKITFNWKK